MNKKKSLQKPPKENIIEKTLECMTLLSDCLSLNNIKQTTAIGALIGVLAHEIAAVCDVDIRDISDKLGKLVESLLSQTDMIIKKVDFKGE